MALKIIKKKSNSLTPSLDLVTTTPTPKRPAGPGLGWHGVTDYYQPPAPTGDTSGGTAPAPAPSDGGGSSGIDLSNPVKRTEYAHSLGYDSWDQYINANQQQVPQQPSFEDLYGDAFRQAFEAVNQMQGAIQSGYQAELSGAELGTQQRKAELQAEQAMRLADFARQRAEAQGQVGLANQRAETQTREGQADTRAQTESVIEQARRQAAELMQGIQARYGGTTGTGRFTSEILGSQATRNIAKTKPLCKTIWLKLSQLSDNIKLKWTLSYKIL